MAFDPILCQKYVEMLVSHDEVERALYVLNNTPAYYRDNVPLNLATLKKDILQAICTTHAYMIDAQDVAEHVTKEAAMIALRGNLRGALITNEVRRYNDQKKVPHIVDMGPGEYFVPIGLLEEGCDFTYNDIGVDPHTKKNALPLIESVRRYIPAPEQPIIFIANEIIEHLHNPMDIVTECLRHCGELPERVHISTPCYTYDSSHKDWRRKSGLPHLRAYTPREFVEEVARLFSGYATQYFDGIIMSVRLMRGNAIDSNPII